MWSVSVIIFLGMILLFLGAATVYLLVLAVCYLVVSESREGDDHPVNRFVVLVPAHNEELLVGRLCESLLQIDYPEKQLDIFIIADNCQDSTVDICRRYPVQLLERFDSERRGKGQALAWALGQIELDRYDAVFIVDADNVVDNQVLIQLNRHINKGEQAIQCFNGVGNRNDSWFTQLLFVSRVVGNLLYHEAKYRIGLSSYLMGNGLCFRSELLQRKGWTAFSVGEDWEYYAQLVEGNVRIAYAAKARVYHQESRSLNQATTQRLRWSSGRFYVVRTYGAKLFVKGFITRNWHLLDASLPLIFPNYSLQVNLTLVSLVATLLFTQGRLMGFFGVAFSLLLFGLVLLFFAGAWLAGQPGKIFRAVLFAPVFLLWKSILDLLCILGVYRNKKWIRTRRYEA